MRHCRAQAYKADRHSIDFHAIVATEMRFLGRKDSHFLGIGCRRSGFLTVFLYPRRGTDIF
jgi:hypothetical protein